MIFVLIYVATMLVLPILRGKLVDPECLRERHYWARKQKDPWGYLLLYGHWGLAALDGLVLHWSNISIEVQIAALVVFLVGSAVNLWAMTINPFFSSVVRIQRDRGQFVIDSGPYRWIRHPGNCAGILAYLSSGIVLGSWLAALVGLLGAIKMIARLHHEDRLLLDELPGYTSYASRVRWRLIPGIW